MPAFDEQGHPALTDDAVQSLRDVLRQLCNDARAALGANFVGAYQVGSSALGHGDEHSDVDFLVVTDHDLDTDQEQAVRAAHAHHPDSPIGWAQHLEGSYVSKAELRRPTSPSHHWLYVDNGQRQMEWSVHDNNAVTRWVMREHGIVLDGPDPETLIDPVTPEEIQQEAVGVLEVWAQALVDRPDDIANAWSQQHAVLAICRFLYSAVTGSVTAKIPAGQWAIADLDPQWQPLIRRAIDDRPDPWGRVHRSADPQLLDPTRRFVAYGLDWARTCRPDPTGTLAGRLS